MEFSKEQEQYIEALVNRAVLKAVKTAPVAEEIRPEAWDFQSAPANQYPGHGWIYVCTLVPMPGRVDIMWRKSRLEIAQQSGTPIMVIPPSK